jgi:hypothetical protein
VIARIFAPFQAKYTIFTHLNYVGILIPGDALGALEDLIGYTREALYRDSINGSGELYDLDARDRYYTHAIVWDIKQNRLVAGCRLFSLLAGMQLESSYLEYSFPGLFTALMQYKQIGEMGRVFVTRSYQKKYSSFLLLMRVVHAFCKQYKITHLMGLASYAAEKYDKTFNQILLMSLQNAFYFDPPKTLPTPRFNLDINIDPHWHAITQSFSSIRQIEACLHEHQANAHKIPVLIRQYLDFLHAKVWGLSQGKSFNNAIEILVCANSHALSHAKLRKLTAVLSRS